MQGSVHEVSAGLRQRASTTPRAPRRIGVAGWAANDGYDGPPSGPKAASGKSVWRKACNLRGAAFMVGVLTPSACLLTPLVAPALGLVVPGALLLGTLTVGSWAVSAVALWLLARRDEAAQRQRVQAARNRQAGLQALP